MRQRGRPAFGEVRGPLLELYAGSGNLTRDLASRGELIAVESQPGTAALARLNLDGLPVEWMTDEAGAALSKLARCGLRSALVVLDPPRSGAREVLDSLAVLRPSRMLYVSCDPMTLARDVSILAGAGYLLQRLRAFDTMPQTHHFETVAELALTPGDESCC